MPDGEVWKLELRTDDGALPRACDFITSVHYDFRTRTMILGTERSRLFYARHLIAEPRRVARFACQLAWLDIKRIFRGEPKPPLQTVDQVIEVK